MIGVLALQGGVREHMDILRAIDVAVCEVRSREEVMHRELRGLILPGGESTVVSKFIDEFGLRDAISARAEDPDFTIFGTCAGLILLAKKVFEYGVISSTIQPLGLLDIDVERNAYGRQSASFVTSFGAFIRAPKITRAGEGAEIIQSHEGSSVLVRQGSVWGGTFHPELVGNLRIHRDIFT